MKNWHVNPSRAKVIPVRKKRKWTTRFTVDNIVRQVNGSSILMCKTKKSFTANCEHKRLVRLVLSKHLQPYTPTIVAIWLPKRRRPTFWGVTYEQI